MGVGKRGGLFCVLMTVGKGFQAGFGFRFCKDFTLSSCSLAYSMAFARVSGLKAFTQGLMVSFNPLIKLSRMNIRDKS